MLLFCLLVTIVVSNGQPQNSSPKLPTKAKPQIVEQSFVVNNNCGLAKAEREMMAQIKAKVDFIAQRYRNGKYNMIFSPEYIWGLVIVRVFAGF